MKTRFYEKTAGLICLLSLLCGFTLAAEEGANVKYPCQLETSLWMIANFFPDPGDFYQLGFGYSLDEKNTFFITGTTWKYPAPIAIPLWDSRFGSPEEEYPGYVRSFGLGLAYQRFLWKGLFTTVAATPFLQNFYSDDNDHLDSGFQLYMQLHTGYQIDFFKGRLYLKPSLSFNYWPVNTNFPSSFLKKENNWPNFFLFEPHLSIGYAF